MWLKIATEALSRRLSYFLVEKWLDLDYNYHMKKNVIIPIFIPHFGCNNDCVFCNQRLITAKGSALSPLEIKSHIETHLTYYEGNHFFKEVGFFGGSFTGIPKEVQVAYLEVAKDFKDKGLIDEIRLSTRPDYIDESILEYLKDLGVDTIELGIQSFDENVLLASKRGHTLRDSFRACTLIKEKGFKLGIQLMIGLPNDTPEKSIYSARKAVEFNPEYARIYPTLILENTELAEMYNNGEFIPFSFEDMLYTAKEMYKLLEDSGAYILRVGLKSTSLINTNADMANSYHPAFRQLIEGEIAKEKILKQLNNLNVFSEGLGEVRELNIGDDMVIVIKSSDKSFSSMIGHKGCNKKYFASLFLDKKIIYKVDNTIDYGKYVVELICKGEN